MFTCGLLRSNFAFAILQDLNFRGAAAARFNIAGDVLGNGREIKRNAPRAVLLTFMPPAGIFQLGR
jgi:hypothetical protein